MSFRLIYLPVQSHVKLECDEKCLIYLLSCNHCRKQYTGQTVNNFCLRWNNINCCSHNKTEGKPVKQQHPHDHVSDENHNNFFQDVINDIDKMDPSDSLKREKYWRYTLKTSIKSITTPYLL